MEGSPHIFYPLASYTHWLQRPHEQKAPRLMQGNGCFPSFHRSFSLLFSFSPPSLVFGSNRCSPSLLMSHSAPFLSGKTTLLLVNQNFGPRLTKLGRACIHKFHEKRKREKRHGERRVGKLVNKKNREVGTKVVGHANFAQVSYVNR